MRYINSQEKSDNHRICLPYISSITSTARFLGSGKFWTSKSDLNKRAHHRYVLYTASSILLWVPCASYLRRIRSETECPGASLDDLHVKGADALPTRKGVPAEGGDYRCGFLTARRPGSDWPSTRECDFLVITRSNKLLFASFAGCFSGLKRIAYGHDDGINTTHPQHVPTGSLLAEDERALKRNIKILIIIFIH